LVVTNASPLIALARTDHLALLRAVYDSVLVGPRVREEVVEAGIATDPIGSRRVADGINSGWIREAETTADERARTSELLKQTRLGKGEAETLAIAEARKLTAIVDDKEARMTAERLGLRYLGTVGVVLEAFAHGHIEREGLETVVRDLTTVLWLSPEVVAEALRQARERRE
jgi:uncharacterized protein